MVIITGGVSTPNHSTISCVEKYPYITHWYSKEGIQLRALGRVFQIYGKIMPICGKCLRFEDKVGIKEDMPLEQGIKEAVDRPLEIVTAFEMLNNKRKMMMAIPIFNLPHASHSLKPIVLFLGVESYLPHILDTQCMILLCHLF